MKVTWFDGPDRPTDSGGTVFVKPAAAVSTSVCGPELDRCTCARRFGPRTAAEIQARHEASVARARRTGWAAAPLPVWLLQMLDPAGVDPWRRAA